MKIRGLNILFACSLLLAACSKDDSLDGDCQKPSVIEVEVSQNLAQGDDASLEAVALKWQNSDEGVDAFSVYGADGNYLGDFEYIGEDGAESGMFSNLGKFAMRNGDAYTAVFPKVDGEKYPDLISRDSDDALEEVQEYTPNVDGLNKIARLKASFTFSKSEPQIAFDNEMAYQLISVDLPTLSSARIIDFKDGDGVVFSVQVPDNYARTDIETYMAVKPNSSAKQRDIEVNIIDQNGKKFRFTKSTNDEFNAGLSYDFAIETEQLSTYGLPSRVDNTLFKYFRPIFSQNKNCCGQASGVGYIYTYEINRMRDESGKSYRNQYPSHWTWLMLSGGTDAGTISWHGWDIVSNIGVPNLEDYQQDGENQNSEERMYAFGMNQMSGYDKWYNALSNKLSKRISWNPSFDNNEDFEEVKAYLAHHGDNSMTGGVVGIWANSNNLKGNGVKTIPSGQTGAGQKIIVDFGTSGGHLMTIAGYDDEIGFDLNGDGKITNHLDINGDYRVNRLDWEKGAFLLVNTWGTSWGNSGKAWLMYRLISESEDGGYKGTHGVFYDEKDAKGRMWTCVPKEGSKPELTLKLEYYHSKREQVTFKIGVALDENATKPTDEVTCSKYYGGFWGLGDIPVMGIGKTNVPVEICIDATSLLSKCPELRTAQKAKYFFTATSDSGEGVIKNLSVVSYTNEADGLFKEFSQKDVDFPAELIEVL